MIRSDPNVDRVSTREATATFLKSFINLFNAVSIIVIITHIPSVIVVIVVAIGSDLALDLATSAAAAGQGTRLVVLIVIGTDTAEAALQSRAEVGAEQAADGEDEAAAEEDQAEGQGPDVTCCSGTQNGVIACARELRQSVGRLTQQHQQ